MVGYFDDEPEIAEEEEPIQGNKPNWIDLVWERLSKGKERASDEILEFKEDMGPT